MGCSASRGRSGVTTIPTQPKTNAPAVQKKKVGWKDQQYSDYENSDTESESESDTEQHTQTKAPSILRSVEKTDKQRITTPLPKQNIKVQTRLSDDNFYFNPVNARKQEQGEHKFITEGVRVPSNEHASVIIGPKFRRVRDMSRRTNVKIISPDPEESPMFILVGERQIDVNRAKEEILSISRDFDKRKHQKR